MEIILLLLDNKRGDSEQHVCFSLVLFAPPHPTLPIPSSNKHTAVQQGRRLVKDSTHFYSGSSSFIYKKSRTHHHDASDTYIILKNNLILLET